MRILFVSNGYPPKEMAGTELYTQSVAGSLSVRHNVCVFCRTVERTRPEHSVIRDSFEGVDVVRMVNNLAGAVEPERYFTDPETDAAFGGILDEFKPDVVHVQHLMGLSGGVIGLAAKRRIPVVVTLHDYWFICPRYQLVDESGRFCNGPEGGVKCVRDCPASLFTVGLPGVFGRSARFILENLVPSTVQKRLKQMVRDGAIKSPVRPPAALFERRTGFLHESLSGADVIVAPSVYVREVFEQNGFGGRITVIPHGIRHPDCRQPVPHAGVRFGYLGSFAQLKGVPLLMEAFGMLKGDAELHIHGHGGENNEIVARELQRLARGARVSFHGGYAQSELGVILAGLDVVVVPSIWPETFGIVVREAMACGVPVIVPDAGALPEAVHDGLDGLVFRCADKGSLAANMQSMVDEPGLAARLGAGIGPVKELVEHVSELETLYGELSRGGVAGHG